MEAMIPKKIHYVWLGKGEKNERIKKCIDSWRKFLPDYEIVEWNEDNFDINYNDFTKKSYELKKYAFTSDVIRLYALYTEGGIYMDTDVEILKPLDEFLKLPAFTGYEASSGMAPVTGLMASAPKGVWVTEQLAYYDDKHFINPDGTLDMTPNTVTISDIMVKNGFEITGKYGVYKDDMHVFPVDYFCPLTSTRVLKLTSNTCCIHHFAGSWVERTRWQKFKNFIARDLIGSKLTDKIVQLKRKLKKK